MAFLPVAFADVLGRHAGLPLHVLPYFFILSLFNAFWYLLALALCSLKVFAKLCVPEKSSFAHM